MKRHLNILFILLIFGSLLVAAGCSKGNAAEPVEKKQATLADAKPVNVKVQALEPTSLQEYIVAAGKTLATTDVTYSAEVAGRVEYVGTDLGRQVKKGQVLARIDYEMLKAQAEQAAASYDLAKKTYERLSTLSGEELISQQQVDEAHAAMIQTEAQVKITKAQLNKSVINATISGVVTNKFVEAGEFVAPGKPMFQIVDLSSVIVEAQLAESQVAFVEEGTKVSVRIDALGLETTGTVDALIPAAHPAAKTFRLRVNVANPEKKIFVGMAANIKMVAKVHESVLVCNQDAIIEENNSRIVYVRDGEYARKREVTPGASQGDLVILADGVKPGDELIVLGQRELVDGQPIRLLNN